MTLERQDLVAEIIEDLFFKAKIPGMVVDSTPTGIVVRDKEEKRIYKTNEQIIKFLDDAFSGNHVWVYYQTYMDIVKELKKEEI